jgi:acetylornithine deacetylase
MDAAIRLLADLVAIDSVNPSLVPGGGGEAQASAYVADRLRAAGMDVEVTDALPGRPNVVGVAEGRAPGHSLLLCGHLDTVGVDDMPAPFDPVVRDGRLFGRGAQDMKAGIAAMIDAATRVLARGLRRGRLLVAGVIDEEYASAGAEALAAVCSADAAVITEPTGLSIGIAHKGFSAAEIVVHGRAAHGSRPADGRDAILRMGRVLAALEALDRQLQERPGDPLLGAASLHAARIDGGGELSSYPARCCLQMERRTLPGEPLSTAADELGAISERLRASDPEFSADVRLLLARPPYALAAGHPLAAALGAACAARGVDAAPAGLSYWTDAAVLGQGGIATVLFGPAGAGLHSPIEYVDLESVLVCRDVLADLIVKWCEADR